MSRKKNDKTNLPTSRINFLSKVVRCSRRHSISNLHTRGSNLYNPIRPHYTINVRRRIWTGVCKLHCRLIYTQVQPELIECLLCWKKNYQSLIILYCRRLTTCKTYTVHIVTSRSRRCDLKAN
jgi:hypothetical protein